MKKYIHITQNGYILQGHFFSVCQREINLTNLWPESLLKWEVYASCLKNLVATWLFSWDSFYVGFQQVQYYPIQTTAPSPGPWWWWPQSAWGQDGSWLPQTCSSLSSISEPSGDWDLWDLSHTSSPPEICQLQTSSKYVIDFKIL